MEDANKVQVICVFLRSGVLKWEEQNKTLSSFSLELLLEISVLQHIESEIPTKCHFISMFWNAEKQWLCLE